MKKLLTALLLTCISAISFSQITLPPTMRNVCLAGNAITRLPYASSATVLGTDTIILFTGGVWKKISASNFASGIVPPVGWSLTGNAGTTVGTNFLGTTDNVSLAFKTNALQRLRILNGGAFIFGAGTAVSGTETYSFQDGDVYVDDNFLVNNAITTSTRTLFGGTWTATDGVDYGIASISNGFIRFLNSTNANTLTINSGVTSASHSWTLPLAQGGASTFLQNDGAGVLSWQAVSTGITVGATTITGGTSGAIPFNSAGVYGEDATKLFWDNTNDFLGLGTATPSGNLEILNSYGGGGAVGMYIENTNTAGSTNINLGESAGDAGFFIQRYNSAHGTVALRNGVDIFNGDNSYMTFGTNNTERIRILAGGFVGIGETVPTGSLHIKGSGADGASHALKIDNSASTALFSVRNDGKFHAGTAAEESIYFGNSSGTSETSAIYNTAFGYNSMTTVSSGSYNTGFGRGTLYLNSTGEFNTAMGYGALQANTTSENTAYGYAALNINTSGPYNTSVGYNSGLTNLTGTNNIFIGHSAGRYETGSFHTYITSDLLGVTDITTGRDSATIHAVGGVQSASYVNISGALRISSKQHTVNNSTSGTTTFSQPEAGTSYKVVMIYLSAGLGTASYTFPVAFTNTPSVVGTNDVATAIVTSISTTAVTVTGTTSTGSLMLIGQ